MYVMTRDVSRGRDVTLGEIADQQRRADPRCLHRNTYLSLGIVFLRTVVAQHPISKMVYLRWPLPPFRTHDSSSSGVTTAAPPAPSPRGL